MTSFPLPFDRLRPLRPGEAMGRLRQKTVREEKALQRARVHCHSKWRCRPAPRSRGPPVVHPPRHPPRRRCRCRRRCRRHLVVARPKTMLPALCQRRPPAPPPPLLPPPLPRRARSMRASPTKLPKCRRLRPPAGLRQRRPQQRLLARAPESAQPPASAPVSSSAEEAAWRGRARYPGCAPTTAEICCLHQKAPRRSARFGGPRSSDGAGASKPQR
mmetsp:Transcript_3936/g.9863  ORF Transcript_3936/g.9863 Transcript_3936/m.9863 type:complete len:216 (-) Transcript_3936:666-1313(-)